MTTQFTPEFMAEQRKLAAKATERPWWVGHSNTTSLEEAKTYACKMLDYNPENTDLWLVGGGDPEGVPLITSMTGNGPTSETNADFVMSAANHYPAALDEIERQQQVNAELLKACKAAENALRSYQYGNGSPDLAEEIADYISAAIARAKAEPQ
jgi:hypothetical protein